MYCAVRWLRPLTTVATIVVIKVVASTVLFHGPRVYTKGKGEIEYPTEIMYEKIKSYQL